ASSEVDGVGLGVLAALPYQLLGKAAWTGSHQKNGGNGTQGLLGVEHQGTNLSAAFEVMGASIDYGDLGESFDVTPIKRQVAGNVSYDAGRLGYIGVGYAMITRYAEASVRTISANYSMRVGERSNLNFTVTRAVTGSGVSTVGFNNQVTTTTEGVTSTSFG